MVASHATAWQTQSSAPALAAAPQPIAPASPPEGTLDLNKSDASGRGRQLPSKTREEIADLTTKAVDDNRIDLYLQPIVARARAWWSICSTMMCTSARAFYFRRRGRRHWLSGRPELRYSPLS
jgi:hypothetical protein